MSTTITKINLTIGEFRSENFLIDIAGGLFKTDDFVLSQNLLEPNILTFVMRKDPKEDASEPKFENCRDIIGKEIELEVETGNFENISQIGGDSKKIPPIKFKGIVTSISGSRSMSQYTIHVEARSAESLLNDNPTCKSYENMTLDEIVEDVTDDYREYLETRIESRFAEKIPYTVQYNESNLDFLTRLARRYGEWFFNNGERMVFGTLPEEEPVILGYPDKDITSYNVDMNIRHTAFSHVASSYNENDSTRKEGEEEMEWSLNDLCDVVFNVGRELYRKVTLQNLHSGGFADSDGRQTILNISTKTQARAEKAGMVTYSGDTFSPRLRIGSKLIIRDNFLGNDLVGNLNDVEQDEILITGLTHYIHAGETYSNSFVGIPAACDYPFYTNVEVFPVSTPCRAKVTNTEDPNSLGRVRVQFDWQLQLDPKMMTPWLRIAQPYAGGGKGFSFIPEIGEEVMVDFEGGNAERPFVKGTMYNGPENPDAPWLPGNNQVKAIRTRNGHTIEIWDEGEGGYIRIYDNGKENYILTFSTDEKLIKLESTGNIELYAKNDIIMHAGHDISASADNDVFISAGNDMQRTADNDIREHAGNDRSTKIGQNDSLTVGVNRLIKIGDNKDERVAHRYQLSSENISLNAKDKFQEYSTTHQIKTSKEVGINAASKIEIKAPQVKTN